MVVPRGQTAAAAALAAALLHAACSIQAAAAATAPASGADEVAEAARALGLDGVGRGTLELDDTLTLRELTPSNIRAAVGAGDNLLVAPVFTDDGQVSFYVPEGRWTHFLNGETYEGGRWYKETYSYMSLPLLARPGAIIPLGSNDTQPDYDFVDGVAFHVFELAEGANRRVEVPATTGETALAIEVSRNGNEIKVKAEGSARNWKLLLRGTGEVAGVTNGASETNDQGVLVTPEAGQDELTITLN